MRKNGGVLINASSFASVIPSVGYGAYAAAKAGVTRQSISVIKARGTCKALTAYKLAAALGVDITELLET